MSERQPKILVIDDDPTWLRLLPMVLAEVGDVRCASTIDQGIDMAAATFFDVIILDMNFENDTRSGLDVFRYLHTQDRGADVIVISGETNPDRLIQILNAGVTQFIPKPATNDRIIEAVVRILERRELNLQSMQGSLVTSQGDFLIGTSGAMQKVRSEIEIAIKSEISDILILGETGTGKELVARYLAESMDPSRRFVPVQCAAISETLAESELFGHVKGSFTGANQSKIGAFEAAGGGFVFLDEIGDMPLPQQAKMLRVLQERKIQRVGSVEERQVNFRTISATHVNLEDRVRLGQFREDLYYRISKSVIRLPALRDRLEDIEVLVRGFISQLKDQPSITDSALALLKGYQWPGNVRQLKSAIEFAALRATAGIIREREVFLAVPQLSRIYGDKASKALIGQYGATVISKERDRFVRALEEAQGSREIAARLLGISRASFFRRAKELGLIRRKARIDTVQRSFY